MDCETGYSKVAWASRGVTPGGIQCMPSGFMPVVIDLQPSMKVTIPWDKPVPRNGNPKRERGADCNPSLTLRVKILKSAASLRAITLISRLYACILTF